MRQIGTWHAQRLMNFNRIRGLREIWRHQGLAFASYICIHIIWFWHSHALNGCCAVLLVVKQKNKSLLCTVWCKKNQVGLLHRATGICGFSAWCYCKLLTVFYCQPHFVAQSVQTTGCKDFFYRVLWENICCASLWIEDKKDAVTSTPVVRCKMIIDISHTLSLWLKTFPAEGKKRIWDCKKFQIIESG